MSTKSHFICAIATTLLAVMFNVMSYEFWSFFFVGSTIVFWPVAVLSYVLDRHR
jgi:hypothetical protein